MKKLALTSLLTLFAISSANAANISNPLYHPTENHFYSQTSADMDTDLELYTINEEFGYGITDKLAVFLNTAGSYNSSDSADTKYSWDNMSLGLNYRVVDMNEWKADVYGKFQQIYDTSDSLEVTWYKWTAGTKFGYMTNDWTIAMVAQADYISDDIDAYDFDAWGMKFGLIGQYVMDSNWNMIAGLDYDFSLTDDVYPDYVGNPLTAKLGVNYNMDASKYIGVYATKDLKSDFSDDPYGWGVKFGIDF